MIGGKYDKLKAVNCKLLYTSIESEYEWPLYHEYKGIENRGHSTIKAEETSYLEMGKKIIYKSNSMQKLFYNST